MICKNCHRIVYCDRDGAYYHHDGIYCFPLEEKMTFKKATTTATPFYFKDYYNKCI